MRKWICYSVSPLYLMKKIDDVLVNKLPEAQSKKNYTQLI